VSVVLINVGDGNIRQEVVGRTNRLLCFHYILRIRYDTDRIENIISNSSIVVCVFIAMGTCLSSHYSATAVSSGSTVLAFRC
jgi:hypothetical protein